MSRVKKTIGLDKIGIEKLPVPEAVKQYFRQLVNQLEHLHRDVREQAEAGGFATKTWRIKENSSGDLVLQKKVNGVWTDVETTKGS